MDSSNLVTPPQKKSRVKPESRRAKRKRGVGKMNFAPASPPKANCGVGWVSTIPLARERQNRIIFFSLIEKIFLFCSP